MREFILLETELEEIKNKLKIMDNITIDSGLSQSCLNTLKINVNCVLEKINSILEPRNDNL